MSVAKQIKIFSNWKKQSSKDSKTKKSVQNIANEYERIGEQKNPDINHNLSSENLILKKFDIREYENIIKNTDYNLNSKNSKYEDIYSTTPTIQATNFVNLGGINLTFLMEKDEWVEYYKDLSNFIKDYMGNSFIPLSEVIQFDEFTPHLQVIGIFRSEVSNEILSNKNLAEDPKLFEEISRKQFTRYNNKLKGTDDYKDPKNKKEYREAKIKWVEENKVNIIKNYKPRNKKTEKKYAYIRNNNPLSIKKNSYADYQNKLYEFNKEHKFIKKLCEKATKIRGEEVSFVKNSTEPVYDGKSKNHYEIKETIERENKEIEDKIQKGIDLIENEVYRYIRKQNREKLKKEFLELDIDAWENEFKEPQKAQYDFKLKLSNDYIKIAKEAEYKPYIELEEQKNELYKELEEIKKEAEDFYKYTNPELIKNLKNIFNEIKKEKNLFGKATGNYILNSNQKEKLFELVRTRLKTNDDLKMHIIEKDKEVLNLKLGLQHNKNIEVKKYKEKIEQEYINKLNNISNKLNYYSKEILGKSFNLDILNQDDKSIYKSLSDYSENYQYSEKVRLANKEKELLENEKSFNLEKKNFEIEKSKILLENQDIKNNLESLSNEKAELKAESKLNEYISKWRLEESRKVKEKLLSEISLKDYEIKDKKEELKKSVHLDNFEIANRKNELLKDVQITDQEKEDYKNKLLENLKNEYTNKLKNENENLLEISKNIGIVTNAVDDIKGIKDIIKIKKEAEELLIDEFVDSYNIILDVAEIKDNEEIYYELSNNNQNIVEYSADIKNETQNFKHKNELIEYGIKNISLISFVMMNIIKVVIEFQKISQKILNKTKGWER